MNVLVKYLLPLAAVAMLAFGTYHVVSSQPNAEKLAPPIAPARTPFARSVAAAGLVEARTENIAIGAAIPGLVLEVYVPASEVGRPSGGVGKFVTKGTPLFRVDDRHLLAQLKYYEANLAAARANLAKLDAMPRREELPSLEAKVSAAEAQYVMAKDQADRANVLRAQEAIASEEHTQKIMMEKTTKQQWEQAKADLALLRAGAWQPDKVVSQAAIELAKAQIEQTKTEIERATVRAPIDGTILQVSVRPGEYVGTQPGQVLMMLGDITRYHVRVDISEHDIPRFQTGAPARAFFRGFAHKELKLTYVRVEPYVTPKKSLTGDNTERVDTRVLQAIYAVEPSEHTVYVGQQLDVFIETPESTAGR